mgnify:FL=1
MYFIMRDDSDTGDLDDATPTPSASVSSAPSNSPVSTISTVAWKTYVNTQYGFEVKHPTHWEVLDDSIPAQVKLALRDKKYSGNIEWPGLDIVTGTPGDYQGTQGDFKGALASKIFPEPINEARESPIRIYFDLNGKRIYASCIVYNTNETLALCNQILSTFRFTK